MAEPASMAEKISALTRIGLGPSGRALMAQLRKARNKAKALRRTRRRRG